MANPLAISAVCEGVINLLRSNAEFSGIDGDLEFKVFLAKDFTQPTIAAGVSLFLYRVTFNGTHRTPAGRMGPNGERLRSALPLDLLFLLTVWAMDASLQHQILGWMMRTMEDSSILPANLLNAATPGVFRDEETVEVILAELSNEDMFRLWETLAENVFHISVPYFARNIRIESTQERGTGTPVQLRPFDYMAPAGR